MEEMTLSEFINSDITCEVFDDYSNDMGYTFQGPISLTEDGERFFSDIMDLNVRITPNNEAFVEIDQTDLNEWDRLIDLVKELFWQARVRKDTTFFDDK